MAETARKLDVNEAEAKTKALAAAVSAARADQRGVPHAKMRDWLLKVASGDVSILRVWHGAQERS
ncbi:conserved hypothetical protein [Rhodospirillaceae bacterium LM-1]|nr:conserved hypothetical protein [Rhodospirillaceae bacterium LM-1]